MSYGAFTATDYLATASTPVTAVPLSMACWFRLTDITAGQNLISVTDTAGDVNYFALQARGDIAGDPLYARSANSATRDAVTSTGYSANTWHHGCAVFTSATSRASYIDGGSKGTNTTSNTPAGLDVISIGIRGGATKVLPVLGLVAEAAIWSAALTDAEVLSAARGVSPLQIRPQSIVFYAPLIRGLQDVRAGLTITMTGTVSVDVHPRIYGL